MKLLEFFGHKNEKVQQKQQPQSSENTQAVFVDDAENQNRNQLSQTIAAHSSEAFQKPITAQQVTPPAEQELKIKPHNPNDPLGSYDYKLPARPPSQPEAKSKEDTLQRMGLGVIKGAARIAGEEIDHIQGKENIGYHFRSGKDFSQTARGRVNAIVRELKKAA